MRVAIVGAGSAETGGRLDRLDPAPLRTLYRVLDDWFPGAALARQAQHWKGARPMLPDGPPVLGESGAPGIWLNLGHGSGGWALACGSARVLAERVAGRQAPLDMTGLTAARLRSEAERSASGLSAARRRDNHRMSSPGGITRIDPAGGPWPLHDAAASRAAEQAALALHAPHALMERAGLAVARLALAWAPHARQVQVWAGPGNNGGDGLVAARHLHGAGKSVSVCLLADPARLPADAAQALDQAVAAGVALHVDHVIHSGGADLAIDALLGIGASRAPAGTIAAAIDTINALQAPVLAVDLPSGLQADTGALLGHAAVRATATLALLTLKPGCCTGHGSDHAGALWLDTLGVAAATPSAWLSGRPARLPRHHADHKGSFGDVAVIGGAPGMVGAAWLAARAALAAGAGRIYCSLLDDSAAALDPTRPELMSRAAWWQSPPAVLARTTVVCGCGGGDAVRAALPPLLSHAARLVLDADALNALAADPALLPLLRARTTRGLATLLTPHPLEAARLLHTNSAAVQHDRLAAARQLASDTGAAVLLKGCGSVIAAPGHRLHINPTGNAALASAGTGDVLAGWAAGLWAQQPDAAAAAVAAAAAWQHGRAADLYSAAGGSGPLRAAALVEALARLPAA